MSTSTTPRRSLTTVVTAIAACAAAVTGIVVVALLSFGGAGSAHASAATPHPLPSHSASAHTTSGGSSTPKPTPTPAPHVVVLPAAQVKTIQSELASLNYYEGPVDGVMNPQTVQAITYLQRDAQLPQNGEWNQVTYLAMQQMIVSGNNQMAG